MTITKEIDVLITTKTIAEIPLGETCVVKIGGQLVAPMTATNGITAADGRIAVVNLTENKLEAYNPTEVVYPVPYKLVPA